MPLPVMQHMLLILMMERAGAGIREDTQCLTSRGPFVDPEAEDLTT